MLTEQFLAALGTPPPAKINGSSTSNKDIGIYIYESQPLTQPRSAFKKSLANPNCLAVSPSHIFAAQADKAVVNVYSREKGSQEATVPFPERITCLALSCDDMVLVMGSAEGRLFLWETHTGRLVITAQAHLQPVTAVTVDPASNFLLSGSADSSIHLWSIRDLLSFSNQNTQAPMHTLSAHRAGITSLVVGHSASTANILVSASKDNTAIVWDYQNNTLLRTILLPATPLCLAIDPADRAVYTGYEDGSVQLLNFYSDAFSASIHGDGANAKNPLYDDAQATLPVQPPATTRWAPPSDDIGATLSCALSHDGSILTTGHANGKILHWDVPLARYSSTYPPTASPLPAPVTNLLALPILGFPVDVTTPRRTKLHAVVKPKHGAFDSSDVDGAVPGDYKISGQFTSSFPVPCFDAAAAATENASTTQTSEFLQALTHPSFPPEMLARGLADFTSWTPQSAPLTASIAPEVAAAAAAASGDAMVLDASEAVVAKPAQPTVEEKNKQLQAEISELRKMQRTTLKQMEEMRKKEGVMLKRLQAAEGKKR